MVYRETFTAGDKSYSAGQTIVEVTVPKGVYIATFTPGYVTAGGSMAMNTNESNNPNRSVRVDVRASEGWQHPICGIFIVNTDNTKIQLVADTALAWQ